MKILRQLHWRMIRGPDWMSHPLLFLWWVPLVLLWPLWVRTSLKPFNQRAASPAVQFLHPCTGTWELIFGSKERFPPTTSTAPSRNFYFSGDLPTSYNLTHTCLASVIHTQGSLASITTSGNELLFLDWYRDLLTFPFHCFVEQVPPLRWLFLKSIDDGFVLELSCRNTVEADWWSHSPQL